MAKAKDINIYKIFSKTYDRSMFGFMGFGELKLMTKVKTNEVKQFFTKTLMMPNETKGRSNVELGSIENRSKAAPDFSKRPGIIENN